VVAPGHSRLKDRFFRRHRDQAFELDPSIRRMVAFAPLNLASDAYPSLVTNTGAMDLVLCRNVLMYFTADAQRSTVGRLQRALLRGGWLVVSAAEASPELLRPLRPVEFPGAIFYRKEAAHSGVPSGWPALRLPPLDLPPAAASAGMPVLPPSTTKQPASVPAAASAAANDVERARTLADQGNLDEARRLCETAATRNRLDAAPRLLLAAICQERGEIDAALEALRQALYLSPESAPAHFLRGALLLRQGQKRRGRRSFETVVALLSDLPRDRLLEGSDGLTAGRLLETARAYLEATG
jgi:chemotaxis protein methyltransferase CheR